MRTWVRVPRALMNVVTQVSGTLELQESEQIEGWWHPMLTWWLTCHMHQENKNRQKKKKHLVLSRWKVRTAPKAALWLQYTTCGLCATFKYECVHTRAYRSCGGGAGILIEIHTLVSIVCPFTWLPSKLVLLLWETQSLRELIPPWIISLCRRVLSSSLSLAILPLTSSLSPRPFDLHSCEDIYSTPLKLVLISYLLKHRVELDLVGALPFWR